MISQLHLRRASGHNRAGGWLAIATLSLLATSPANAGETFEDAQYGFKLTLPDGFTRIDDRSVATPASIHAFYYGEVQEGRINTLLIIEHLGEPLAHRRMERADLPPSFTGRLLRATWRGLELAMTEIPESSHGQKVLTYNVPIPLKAEAIQLKICGPGEQQAELKALTEQVLAGLSGASNWPSSPTATTGRRMSDRAILLMSALVFLGILVALWLVSLVAPRGSVLVLAILLIGASTSLQPSAAMGHVIVPLVRLAGIAGLILGIGDLIRKRKTNPPPV